MDKCFDVLISIMEKKGAEGYIQLIEGLDNKPKQGYKCGLCKIISYCLRKNNKSLRKESKVVQTKKQY